MTKAELLNMIKNYDDNDELMFVIEKTDRDGYPYDTTANVYKIVTPNAKRVIEKYGIARYRED